VGARAGCLRALGADDLPRQRTTDSTWSVAAGGRQLPRRDVRFKDRRLSHFRPGRDGHTPGNVAAPSEPARTFGRIGPNLQRIRFRCSAGLQACPTRADLKVRHYTNLKGAVSVRSVLVRQIRVDENLSERAIWPIVLILCAIRPSERRPGRLVVLGNPTSNSAAPAARSRCAVRGEKPV